MIASDLKLGRSTSGLAFVRQALSIESQAGGFSGSKDLCGSNLNKKYNLLVEEGVLFDNAPKQSPSKGKVKEDKIGQKLFDLSSIRVHKESIHTFSY